MSREAPATPVFTAELEARLVDAADGHRHRRWPFRPGALRVLRELSRSTLHAAFACGVAATLLLVSPTPLDEQPPPLGPDLSASLTPGYLHQYGARNVDQTIAVARERGYEVQLITWYVPDHAAGGRVLSIRHAGELLANVPEHDRTRGPLLIVVGLTMGDGSSTAN